MRNGEPWVGNFRWDNRDAEKMILILRVKDQSAMFHRQLFLLYINTVNVEEMCWWVSKLYIWSYQPLFLDKTDFVRKNYVL